MQYMNPAGALFTMEFHWLSGGASERRIRRSEVRFWVRTYFFLSQARDKTIKQLSVQVLSKQGKHQLFPKYELELLNLRRQWIL